MRLVQSCFQLQGARHLHLSTEHLYNQAHFVAENSNIIEYYSIFRLYS